jgi:flagellum-specific peptidoglycan hydrolase FlgJ
MIAVLTDIPIETLEEIVNDFVSEGAANLSPLPANTLPDPTDHRSGIYGQADGNFTVVALLPDADGAPAVDPNLTIESPSSFTKFTDLKQTVSTLTAESIDHFFAMQSAAHQSLKGIGQPVIDAARKYAINASYIVAHAILESGWGTLENQSPKKQYLRMECI